MAVRAGALLKVPAYYLGIAPPLLAVAGTIIVRVAFGQGKQHLLGAQQPELLEPRRLLGAQLALVAAPARGRVQPRLGACCPAARVGRRVVRRLCACFRRRRVGSLGLALRLCVGHSARRSA